MEMLRRASGDETVDVMPGRPAEELEEWTTRAPEESRNGARGGRLRHGDLTLHVETGVLRWGTHELTLTRAEREVLAVLLTRAGQILSPRQLAHLLDTPEDTVEERLGRLTVTLDAAGVRCKPRRAAGLGYILWSSR